MKSIRLGVLFGWLMLILAPSVVAQETNGIIQGTVADAAGAVVAAAKVTVVSDTTDYTRTVTSGADGSYAFTELPPGHYHVKVTKEGFKTQAQQDIELHAASTVVLNMKLTVGSVSETLTVEANPIAVETTTDTLGTITEGAQVRELPLNGLNFIGLTLLVPGASTQDGFSPSTKGVLGGSDISFSGGQRTGNVFTQDGVPDNDMGSQRTILLYPSLDSISEIKTVTNNYGPEYGQSGGAQVNIVTKSGTNGLHGSVYYFGRNDALDANNWFNTNTAPTIRKGELRRNDFGFSLGGPVKKDKLFFFSSLELNREVDGDLHAGQTPSAAELSGDFSGVTTGTGGLPHLTNCYYNPSAPQFGIIDFPVTDPYTGTAFGPVTSPTTGLPTGDFQNISQTSEGFSPAGQLISQLYPASNVTPTAANPCPNPDYKQILNSPVNLWQFFGRGDYYLNHSTQLFVTYTQSHWVQPAPSLPGGEWGDTGFPAVDSSWAQPSKVTAIHLQRQLGATAVNDFQFSYSGNRIYITTGGTDPTLPQQIYGQLTPNYPISGKTAGGNLAPPVFWGPGGYSTLWNAAPWYNRMDRYTWTDDYSKVVGKHQFKFGALLAHNLKDQANNGDFNESPALWGATGGPGTCTAGDTCGFPNGAWGGGVTGPLSRTEAGNAIAAILLKGTVFGYGESSNLHEAAGRYQDYEFYGGDSFRVSRRVTLNYGLRWSLLMQPYAADNELSFFNPSLFSPNVPSSACDGLLVPQAGSLTCAAAGAQGFKVGSGRSLISNVYHNIAPRVGIAWDLFGDGRTSIRAGAGQFFVRYQLDPFIIQGTQNPPFIEKASDYRYLDGTVPAGNGGTGFGYPGFGRSSSADIPNNWQWNLSISRELFRNNTMQVSYVGNRGIHLQNYTDLAQITPVAGNPVSTAANQNVCAAPYAPSGIGVNVPVGLTCRQFFSIVNINEVGGNANLDGVGNGTVAFRPYMSYFGQAVSGQATFNYADFTGYSNYNSLQAVWKGKIDSRGSIYQFSYTWSKALGLQGGINGLCCIDISDNLNPRLDYGPTQFNRPQMFTGSVVYALPSLRGGNAFEQKALGGWSIDPIVTFTSGVPVDPSTGGAGDLWGTGTNSDRPNVVPGQPCRAHGTGIESQWINPNKFTIYGLPLGTDGNASIGNCYGPGQNNWDIAIHKDFKINERLNVQFRFEFFNAFNKTQFEGVNGGLGGAQVCFGDSSGNLVPVNAPTSAKGSPLLNDQCYLTGNPLGMTQTIPDGTNVAGVNPAYQIIQGPGGVSTTLNSPNSISQSGFGQATFTRPPRQIQYALRFTF
jgi:Carboxypeptidase regulatory-like domain